LKTTTVVGTGRVEFHLRKRWGKHFPKLLEFQADFPDVFFASVPDQQEILRAHPNPRIFRDYCVLGNCEEKTETNREAEQVDASYFKAQRWRNWRAESRIELPPIATRALPSFSAGLNLISQAAKIAFSVSPYGSRLTTLTRSILPSPASKILSAYDSLYADASRLARVTGLRPRSNLRFDVNFFR
jgi:hypothetical protein